MVVIILIYFPPEAVRALHKGANIYVAHSKEVAHKWIKKQVTQVMQMVLITGEKIILH